MTSRSPLTGRPARPATPSNRLGLDYEAEAARLGPPTVPIIDVHSHINGGDAARLYDRVRGLFGVERTYSMTQLDQTEAVSAALGDSIRYIAVPDYMARDRRRAMEEGFLENIQAFHELGARIVKFWNAPRKIDYAREMGVDPASLRLDGEWNQRAMKLASSLDMMFMTHIGDPDTWFATKYSDASIYGAKRDHYIPLERMLDAYPVPWIAAHMGGWPEDLGFIDGLLTRHDNLHLDTSATKWMVRELSRHSRDELLAFLEKWSGRILFGSDIVTLDAHLGDDDGPRGMGTQASSEDDAFDLYASRYWSLRTLYETDYDGESPIADPDLAMVAPESHDAMSAPRLAGKSLPDSVLRMLYRDAAMTLLGD